MSLPGPHRLDKRSKQVKEKEHTVEITSPLHSFQQFGLDLPQPSYYNNTTSRLYEAMQNAVCKKERQPCYGLPLFYLIITLAAFVRLSLHQNKCHARLFGLLVVSRRATFLRRVFLTRIHRWSILRRFFR